MSNPAVPPAPTTPTWVLRPFQLTVPFRMHGELQYQSWTDFERLLTGNLTLGSLPQLSFEFGQNVTRLQGALGMQVWETELPRMGPFITSVGVDGVMRWADTQQVDLTLGLDVRNVNWPSLRFSIEGSMSLSGLDQAGQPQLGGEITGNLRFNFDLFAPRGTFRRR